MKYTVYIHKTSFDNDFHHRIVVEDSSGKHGKVVIGLQVDSIESGRVIPECGQYQGSVSELEFAGNVIKTLREMAEIAMDILVKMGKYDLLTNNCQTFVNKFLGRIGLESAQYCMDHPAASRGWSSRRHWCGRPRWNSVCLI